MNPGQVARIAHEVQRVRMPHTPAWEKVSPEYRRAATSGAALILEGRLPLYGLDPAVTAVFAACMPAPLDLNEETGVEPERKPGYNPKDLEREAPALRAMKAPGECVSIKTFS